MAKLFLWFYCLPIGSALLLILLATAVFFLLRERFGKRPYWKSGICVLFLGWLAVILLGTLVQRTEGGNLSEPILTPFASYYAVLNGETKELLRTNFMNAVLFYPAGLMGCELLPKRWKRLWKAVLVTVLLALLSCGIEYTQYRFHMGLAEVDDIIHNTLGALAGALICLVPIKSGLNLV